MSSDVVIKVDGLGKCYQIYEKPHHRLLQMMSRGRRQYYREFWALQGVSFEVVKGETLGIVGCNGSGKSTLLQMICGTLNPSQGQVGSHGRVAALLELGAGFNPEFTGRENVYMAAALYGLDREAVDARLEDIEGFADIGQHFDQPVKTYSSGMYVRLAFAVIAHVDADVLVIDEALAVGDAVFTQKCMRYIRAFQQQGTLLFVSHDMGSVLNLCKTAIWLDHGRVMQHGEAKEVAEAYLQSTLQQIYGAEAQLAPVAASKEDAVAAELFKPVVDYGAQMRVQDNLEQAGGWKSGVAEILEVRLGLADGSMAVALQGGERVCMCITALAHQDLASPILGFLLKDRLGQDLFGENTLVVPGGAVPVCAGQQFTATFSFVLPMLPNGQYAVLASVADGDLYNNIQHHYLHDALIVQVASSRVRWGLVGVHFDRVELKV